MIDMRIQDVLAQVKQEAAKVIIGQQDVLDQALIAICCGQHALIEGVPGLAKTLLVRTLAKLLGCDFGRIQFTPDLMPSDITGTTIFDMRSQEFKVMKGPVFTTFLLADEINRAPAKTQSALCLPSPSSALALLQQNLRRRQRSRTRRRRHPRAWFRRLHRRAHCRSLLRDNGRAHRWRLPCHRCWTSHRVPLSRPFAFPCPRLFFGLSQPIQRCRNLLHGFLRLFGLLCRGLSPTLQPRRGNG